MFELKINCTNCGHANRLFLSERTLPASTCSFCRDTLFELREIKGFVYILSNPLMPGILKIGYSTRDVKERVKELESTGVPGSFEIEAYFLSESPEKQEVAIHKKLAEYRLPGKEFFEIDIESAIIAAISIMGDKPIYRQGKAQSQNEDCFGKLYIFRDTSYRYRCSKCALRTKCEEESG